MRTAIILGAISSILVGATPSRQGTLDVEELARVLETAIGFTLQSSARSSKANAASLQLYLDTTSSFANLREAGIAAEVKLSRALGVGQQIAPVSREKILACPTPKLSSACSFLRPATSVWIGATRRLSAKEVSVLVHVMSPSASGTDGSHITGYSMEVIVSPGPKGRWSVARIGKVVAG